MRGIWYVLLAVVILFGAAAALFSLPPSVPLYAATRSIPLSNCEQSSNSMTIIADSHGYNDSVSFGSPSNPWPIVNARQGSQVNLVVCNSDSVDAHGFAIDSYEVGIVLAPGTAYSISFTASYVGHFRIYCTILCPVHKYMSGMLVVS